MKQIIGEMGQIIGEMGQIIGEMGQIIGETRVAVKGIYDMRQTLRYKDHAYLLHYLHALTRLFPTDY